MTLTEKQLIFDEKEIKRRVKKIRNQSLQRLCILYWKFGFPYFRKSDVLAFIKNDLSVHDKSTQYAYYNSFQLLSLLANKRRARDLISNKEETTHL